LKLVVVRNLKIGNEKELVNEVKMF